MNDEVIKLLAERYFKKERVSDWTIKCLEKGFDSKSLQMLASMSDSFTSPFELDDYYRRSLEELNWDNTNPETYLMRYAKSLAGEIIEEKTDPLKASREIYQIIVALDYPPELHSWFEIDEIIWDYEHFVKTGKKYSFFHPKDELISIIKRFSEELINSKESILIYVSINPFHSQTARHDRGFKAGSFGKTAPNRRRGEYFS